MNFKEWYQIWFRHFRNRHASLNSAKSGWNACKYQVLKIFEKHKITPHMTLDDIEREIKKL